MFLLILESIGTPELILIAVVALIVFGPRKLPQMAKTMAKTMAEFKNATNEFKSTWEKEITIEEEVRTIQKEVTLIKDEVVTENSISKTTTIEVTEEKHLSAPEVKELSAEEISLAFKDKPTIQESTPQKQTENSISDKRSWL